MGEISLAALVIGVATVTTIGIGQTAVHARTASLLRGDLSMA